MNLVSLIPCYLLSITNQPAFIAADADFISLGDVDGGLAKMGEDLSFEGQADTWARHQRDVPIYFHMWV